MNTEKRLVQLQDWLVPAEQPDGILISTMENIRYLSGFTGSFAYLIVTPAQTWLLTDARYRLQAEKESPACETILLRGPSVEGQIAAICTSASVQTLGFEKERILYRVAEALKKACKEIELVPTSRVVERLRAIKDEDEVAKIAQSQAIAEAAFEEVAATIKPGLRERDVALALEIGMRRRGATDKSFDTIVASGGRSAMPHGVAGEKILEAGDLIVMDFGCKFEGYCSDMTRTLALGPVSKEQRDLYALVLEAQEMALAAIGPGVKGKDIQKLVQDYFDAAGFGAYFGHGLGHSLGLEIHEEPRFSPSSEDTILSGTCITVEPGLYLPGLGGVRIEDVVCVREHGIENLNHTAKDLLVL